jgi:hypothetical protein
VLEIAEDLDGSLRTLEIRKTAEDLDGSLRISKIWKIAEDLDGSLRTSKIWEIAGTSMMRYALSMLFYMLYLLVLKAHVGHLSLQIFELCLQCLELVGGTCFAVSQLCTTPSCTPLISSAVLAEGSRPRVFLPPFFSLLPLPI